MREERLRTPRRARPPLLPRQAGPPSLEPNAAAQAEAALAETGHAMAALLRLLAQEAPAESFPRLLELAADDGRSSPELSAAVSSALEVRALLDVRRRREQELAALYATAGDLSSLHDLEAVLQAIVRRARSLLDTDVAYLTLNDEERGATYMRVTEGIRTGEFKQVELPMGAGLGGLVAATCTPYATADYRADARFLHTIDDVVTGEGLVAILGVPLRLGERVIGVLFAANRRERPFSRDEVALLMSLADHAAIAIENASLFQDLRSALDELREASRVISAHSESVERAAAVHERLSAVLLQGGGLPEVAASVVDVLGGSLVVLDAAGRELVVAGPPVSAEVLAQVPALPPAAGRPTSVANSSDEPVVVAPVSAGADVLGHVVAVGRRLDDAEVRILERAAVVTALVLLQQRSIADAENRLRGELFEELFAVPQRHVADLHRRALHLGVDLARPHVVAVARVADRARAGAAARAGRAVHGTDGLSGQYRGDVVLLLPGEDATSAARLVGAALGEAAGCPVTVGAVGPGTGAGELAELYQEAARCCDVLLSLGREGDATAADALGVYGLLLTSTGQEELQRFVRRTIGAVLDYDRDRRSELERTLLAYYACAGNLTRTAADLFVHVNTLYQRLDRVTTLLGEGWRTGDGSLQVHLALQLHAALQPR